MARLLMQHNNLRLVELGSRKGGIFTDMLVVERLKTDSMGDQCWDRIATLTAENYVGSAGALLELLQSLPEIQKPGK